ncbi:aminopeptidase P family protein [Curvivirga sp.]|uniref:aminopeptidase P family protein n=1 Tax=Curvivirga sp. TaxID=2856848 RepID=UPI003B5AEEB1
MSLNAMAGFDELECKLNESEVLQILRGVIAAPDGYDESWMDMIQMDRSDALSNMLKAAKIELEESNDAGFTDGPAPEIRVSQLREAMKEEGVSAFLVPRTDEYLGEYVPTKADRLWWLTGFAGSAGMAIIGLKKAAIFVDGRYTIQVTQQVSEEVFDYLHLISDPYTDWLVENFGAGDVVAFDPWIHSHNSAQALRRAAERGGFELRSVETNLIDKIWEQQPAAPLSAIQQHPVELAGETAESKTVRLGDDLSRKDIDAAVIAAPDCIAWLLNIRGQDVANCPLPLSFSILFKDGTVDLFVDERKMLPATRQHLGNNVSIKDIAEFSKSLQQLGQSGQVVQADPATVASAIFENLKKGGANIKQAADPVLIPRAVKNEVELNGTRACHIRDGAAIARFLSWLPDASNDGTMTELDAVYKLEEFRRMDPTFRDSSFDTISGAGPNGAICHYRVTEKTNLVAEKGTLLLVDSGAQYPDGTTDITRTMPVGEPTQEMKDRFTLVLKGHIAIAQAQFPEGITGARLDTLARAPLWQYGLDFDHGTGHGVGSYLNVHEGPQRIATSGSQPLLPGMILSNEPGYYKDSEYGIRIENLVIVVEKGMSEDGKKKLLGFETITFAPINLDLVNKEILSSSEVAWLNEYHQQVWDKVSSQLDEDNVKAWLKEATRSI